MKKLILFTLVILANCNIPTIECQPNLPCTADQLKYVKYEPPAPQQPTIIYPSQPVISLIQGNGQLTVTWPACTDTDSYDIYFSTVSGGIYALVQNITSPYTILSLTNDVRYFVIISAKNANGKTDSLEKSATPGTIDNLNGTISVVSTGLTWSKCSQSDAIGNDTYNALNNDCSNGVPTKFVYCDTRWYCTDPAGLALNGSGVSEVYNTCALKGIGWRVAKRDELLAFNTYYSKQLWPDVVNDWYYPIEGWNQPQPYGGYVWINPIGGYFGSANFADFTNPVTKGYVICVR